MRPDFSSNRFEIKYVMHANKAEALKSSLSDILIADAHTSDISEGYFNHSIYFDSYGLQRYLEKHEGHDRRIKIRLRSYREYQDGETRRRYLELKHRLGGIVKKERLEVTASQAQHLLHGELTPPEGLDIQSPVVKTYMYHARNSLLRPVVALQYHRMAYFSHIYPDLRVTFDRRVMATKDTNLPQAGSAGPGIPALHPSFRVVELKYNNSVPRLVIDRFRAHGLKQVTFSKYATALETVNSLSL